MTNENEPRQDFALTVLNFIMQFKNTKAFLWVKTHPQLSLSIVITGGIIIMVMFLIFIVTLLKS